MMFKIPNGQTPDYLSNKFIFHNDTTSYRLRNSDMRLALPQPRTDYVHKVSLIAVPHCGIASRLILVYLKH